MSDSRKKSTDKKVIAKLPACAAVIVAAGSGSRFGGPWPKQFLEVSGKTILRYCLDRFLKLDELKKIVVVLPPDRAQEFQLSLSAAEARRVAAVAGGPTRQDSVVEGLKALDQSRVKLVAIHDAARPLISPGLIRETLRVAAAGNCGAAACAPVQDTVKRAGREKKNPRIETTVDRKNLWLTQTPQSFPLEVILEAHLCAREQGFQGTDDASVCERLGLPVRIVASDAGNLKVTTQSDLPFLKYRLRQQEEDREHPMKLRIGEGYDIHRLVEGRPLVLGGVNVPHDKGLLGHSDADALLHAVADSLLGAAALGDIGTHFPDTDARYAGADSAVLLARVVDLLQRKNFRPVNVDATLIAQSPKLAPYVERMRSRIAEILSLPVEHVSVKATTHEGLGALGRAEGIAARAVSLVQQTA